MSMSSNNYVVFIPHNFKIENHIKELKKLEIQWFECDDQPHLTDDIIKAFKKFQFDVPSLQIEQFGDNTLSIYMTIEEFIHNHFEGFWIGRAYSYEREIYNISANKEITEKIIMKDKGI